MEDHSRRDPERDSSQGVSNRGIPPLLHQPGNPPAHKITNFCIENILKPGFGRKVKSRALDRGAQSGSKEERASTTDPHLGEGRHEGNALRPEPEGQHSDPQDRNPDLGHEEREEPSRSRRADNAMLWPAWVYCTRYSDRPSSGPRSRKAKKPPPPPQAPWREDKRPRTAFTLEQLQRLKTEFVKNQYLTDERRQSLSRELGLNESQIKIWFQNKRAKMKKASGGRNSLAQHLMAQGLYDHSTLSACD